LNAGGDRDTIDIVSTEGWIFMVGFRVFDVGLLIVWLIWFFRLRDDDDSSDDDGGGGGGPEPGPRDDPGGGGLGLPLGWARTSNRRIRDHSPPRRPARQRGAEPVPRPLPARVRRPSSPVPAHRVR
jgi:hypothetical protein